MLRRVILSALALSALAVEAQAIKLRLENGGRTYQLENGMNAALLGFSGARGQDYSQDDILGWVLNDVEITGLFNADFTALTSLSLGRGRQYGIFYVTWTSGANLVLTNLRRGTLTLSDNGSLTGPLPFDDAGWLLEPVHVGDTGSTLAFLGLGVIGLLVLGRRLSHPA